MIRRQTSGSRFLLLVLLLAAGLLAGTRVPPAATAQTGPVLAPTEPASLFVENVGQYAAPARFLMLRPGGMAWLAEDGVWLTAVDDEALRVARQARDAGRESLPPVPAAAVRLQFVGANARSRPEPFDPRDTVVSYFKGPDPAGWYPAVPVWGGVRYRDLYPGIDLVLGGAGQSALAWHLEVDDGADLNAVRLAVAGATMLAVAGGEMVIGTSAAPLRVPLLPARGPGARLRGGQAPTAAPIRQEGDFLLSPLNGGTVDGVPVATTGELRAPAAAADLAYSTFLGGSQWDTWESVVVDDGGDGLADAYMVGSTASADFPATPGAYDIALNSTDAIVARIEPAGDGSADLRFATYLGGSTEVQDGGTSIAVAGGLVYVGGGTSSPGFPTTTGAYDDTCGVEPPCDGRNDSFLSVLSDDGSSLVYSTFLGGVDDDLITALDVAGGDVYLVGETRSDDFPTTAGAFDRSCGIDGKCDPESSVPTPDIFFALLDPAGGGSSDLLYGTFIGGSGWDGASDIHAGGGHAFIAGSSDVGDFPAGGYSAGEDGFALRLNPAGGGSGDLVFGTFLGGSGDDDAKGIALDGEVAYLTGVTDSADFPVTAGGAYRGGADDAFLARLDAAGTVTYAAFLGGSGADLGWDLHLDAAGGVVVAGYTHSVDFPVTADAYAAVPAGGRDIFAARIDLASPLPQHIVYASYLGGSGYEEASQVVVDEARHAYFVGYTRSADFPSTVGAYDGTLDAGIGEDSYLARLFVGPRPVAVSLSGHLDQSGTPWLTWTHDPANEAYDVYASPAPYFTPSGSATTTVPAAGDTYEITDWSQPRYYRAQPWCCNREVTAPVSNELGVFPFSLVPGG